MSTQKASRPHRTPHRAASRAHVRTLHHHSWHDAFSGTTALSILLFAVVLAIALLAWGAFGR